LRNIAHALQHRANAVQQHAACCNIVQSVALRRVAPSCT
jgi:hypothetical protein